MQDFGKKLQRAVRDAAQPILPGMGIQAQINAACVALGYRKGHWRVRDAWYGYATNWQGKYIAQLEDRYSLLLARRATGIIAGSEKNQRSAVNQLTNVDGTLTMAG